ncbi:TonB-dependent receptor [Pedobacter sp. P351]|uniref:TonB-dependent receptor n=1 Tax=Pedobacter superstes TaxID=3133441 RepID=UPI0030AB50DD
MKLKAFSTIFFCFIALSALAQYKISGSVISTDDSLAVIKCSVLLNDNKSIAVTDSKGEFIFKNIPSGQYTLLASCIGYSKETFSVTVAGEDVSVVLNLSSGRKLLSEVAIKVKKNELGFGHLHAVENLGIYEGKKSELIIPDQLVANLATNNARQVYSRVAGLNIWENDGAGLQLSIGGRGLDPNRTSNFNVRQNGYDISADALGYPESYYTPPIEAVGQIQIVRGAASLQYGTQFGGLINFIIRKPVTDRKLELTARQSIGSYGFYNAFTSASGTVNKLSYYTYFQYKKGNGWRPNSEFDSYTGYANVNYQLTEKTKAGIDITHMDYLAHQPGGLTDDMFAGDPLQSNRERNWFKVNWNLFALNLDHKFNAQNEFNLRVFGLSASRYTVGFRPNRVATADDNSERDLIKGDFENWGAEARYLKRYSIKNVNSVLLVGSRYYHGFNHSVQGFGSKGKDADFSYINSDELILNDYKFPNQNVSMFAENIFWLSPKLSVVPGLRYEIINTKADGFYASRKPSLDETSIELGARTPEKRQNKRNFLIAGLGISYKPGTKVNIYGNLSQNYRSITFSDIRIANPSAVIDPDMTDEKGYSFDLGIRSEGTFLFNYDVSAFYLNYNNRIGEYQISQGSMVLRKRTNIGQAVIAGIESYAEADLFKILHPQTDFTGVVFTNAAFIKSEYKKSVDQNIEGNEVEFVPGMNLKSGIRLGYKKLKASFQYSYLSDQYSDATNAPDGGFSGIVGIIPAYSVMDAGVSYEFKRFRLEGNVNNLTNEYYFTRRATGYPGPGIIPSDNRTFYLTLQVKF